MPDNKRVMQKVALPVFYALTFDQSRRMCVRRSGVKPNRILSVVRKANLRMSDSFAGASDVKSEESKMEKSAEGLDAR